MRSTLRSFCGWLTLEIEFDPVVIDQERAVEPALSAHGLCPGEVHVVTSSVVKENFFRRYQGEEHEKS
jgi:hypothetical protein